MGQRDTANEVDNSLRGESRGLVLMGRRNDAEEEVDVTWESGGCRNGRGAGHLAAGVETAACSAFERRLPADKFAWLVVVVRVFEGSFG
jgi:hypothetical protein